MKRYTEILDYVKVAVNEATDRSELKKAVVKALMRDGLRIPGLSLETTKYGTFWKK